MDVINYPFLDIRTIALQDVPKRALTVALIQTPSAAMDGPPVGITRDVDGGVDAVATLVRKDSVSPIILFGTGYS